MTYSNHFYYEFGEVRKCLRLGRVYYCEAESGVTYNQNSALGTGKKTDAKLVRTCAASSWDIEESMALRVLLEELRFQRQLRRPNSKKVCPRVKLS